MSSSQIYSQQMNAKLIAVSSEQAQLSGQLDRLAGKELLEQGRRLIAKSNGQWQVDLAEVHHSSSVGIALLMDWLRYGKRKNKAVEFLNVPQKMRDVIEFSGLSTVFNLK
jgi:phospholipid transport system transporter-binding protein